MKRCSLLLTVVLMILSLSTGLTYAADRVQISIDGQLLAVDVPPVIVKGRTLAPMGAVQCYFCP
ncbi:hypothetical protein SAMN02745975_00817 [Geosporobacter subterraneus DSM 17957]|uniref:Copper amine oxidase N-terminal domain-containing protein n=1 Tax=Geosporobacter subterraneus DSM 17957 TaxID=1121919 RepID=A0A1M6ETA7_9FIRM|nr:hypothetical protein [Geosporobacter subterraneus]SHI88580.1 hypothetical protein SAMN02745975_00817 [Geosporobacter subterraneus DSM 17957]